MDETEFDKKEWTITFKKNNRDFATEAASRFKPLILIKKDFITFVDDMNREIAKTDDKFNRLRANKFKEIFDIRDKVLICKKMKENMAEDETLYDKIQVEVNEINDTFKKFKIKNKNHYGKLANDEETLTRELELLQEKYDAIVDDEKACDRSSVTMSSRHSVTSSATKHRPASVTSSRTKKSMTSHATSKGSRRPGVPLPPSTAPTDAMSVKMLEYKDQIEVIQEKISELGGFHCGWTPSDHEDFLRVRTKHKHKTDTLSFLNEILGLIPDCNLDKVKEHIAVHKQYMELCKQKKDLLEKYKQEKILQRNMKLSDIEHTKNQRENNSRLSNRAQSASRRGTSRTDKEKIKKWREQKEKEKQLKLTEAQKKKEREKQLRKEKIEYEREQKAIKIREYQLKRELEREQQRELEDLERKKKRRQVLEDQETRERIFKREEDLFRKRAEMVIVKKCEEEENLARFERSRFMIAASKYDKVESKLNEPTKAAKGKARDKFREGKDDKKDAMTFGGRLVGPSVRAMPSWRKGL